MSASVTAGTCAGAARMGLTEVACAAPAPRTPAAMMVTVYFMTDYSNVAVRRFVRVVHLTGNETSKLGQIEALPWQLNAPSTKTLP